MKLLQSEKKGPSALSRQEALKCVPVINTSVSFSALDSGEILLEYPLRLKPFFLSVFRRFQHSYQIPTKRLQLDEMGSRVWKDIDGENNVQSIIRNFAAGYNITLHEAEKSITAFLADLGRRGIIALR